MCFRWSEYTNYTSFVDTYIVIHTPSKYIHFPIFIYIRKFCIWYKSLLVQNMSESQPFGIPFSEKLTSYIYLLRHHGGTAKTLLK
jgi:hypothetical protein